MNTYGLFIKKKANGRHLDIGTSEPLGSESRDHFVNSQKKPQALIQGKSPKTCLFCKHQIEFFFLAYAAIIENM